MNGLDVLGAVVLGDSPSAKDEGIPAWKYALGGLAVVLGGLATYAAVSTHRGVSTAASREEAARAHREFHLARGDWA